MRTESLTEDMHNFGFTDFDKYENKTYSGEINYCNLLNDESKKLVMVFIKKTSNFSAMIAN